MPVSFHFTFQEIQDRLLHKTVSWGRAGAAVRGLLHDPVRVMIRTASGSMWSCSACALHMPRKPHAKRMQAMHPCIWMVCQSLGVAGQEGCVQCGYCT